MHKLRLELQVEHLGWQVLPPCIVERHAPVLATSDEQIAVRAVRYRTDRLVKLGEVVTDARLLDVEDAHRAGLEPAGEDGQGRVCRHAEGLVYRTGELDDLIERVQVPEADRVIEANRDHILLGEVEVHADNGRCVAS